MGWLELLIADNHLCNWLFNISSYNIQAWTLKMKRDIREWGFRALLFLRPVFFLRWHPFLPQCITLFKVRYPFPTVGMTRKSLLHHTGIEPALLTVRNRCSNHLAICFPLWSNTTVQNSDLFKQILWKKVNFKGQSKICLKSLEHLKERFLDIVIDVPHDSNNYKKQKG